MFDSSPGAQRKLIIPVPETRYNHNRIKEGPGIVRAFVAIDLSPEIREKMREVQEAIRKSGARITLVDPAIIHITIKFLGEIEAPRVGPVREALSEVILEPFDLTITGISANNNRNPRVIWGTAGDSGGCRLLFEQVETALTAIGVPRDERGFTPHATIARVKEYHPSLMQSIRPYLSETLGECHISGFSLKKITLTPTGPVYDTILEVVW